MRFLIWWRSYLSTQSYKLLMLSSLICNLYVLMYECVVNPYYLSKNKMCCEGLDIVWLYYVINETFLVSFITFFFTLSLLAILGCHWLVFFFFFFQSLILRCKQHWISLVTKELKRWFLVTLSTLSIGWLHFEWFLVSLLFMYANWMNLASPFLIFAPDGGSKSSKSLGSWRVHIVAFN